MAIAVVGIVLLHERLRPHQYVGIALAGIGTALLSRVAAITLERGYRRLEWAVLEWNTPAIRFYERRGTIMADWRTCRLDGDALARLGAG